MTGGYQLTRPAQPSGRFADAHIVSAMEDVVTHIRTRTTVTVNRITVRLRRQEWV